MPQIHHQFVLELSKPDGPSIGRAAVTIDWLPAVEHAHFSAIAAGVLPAVTATPPCVIEPVWDPAQGRPYVDGVYVVMDPGGAQYRADIPLEYFGASAQAASSKFVKDGALTEGETFRYRVTAFPAGTPAEGPAEPGTEVVVEEVAQPLGVLEAPLRTLLDESVLVGTQEPGDVPVFLPHRLLQDASALVREAGDEETGGVLVGQLQRDTACPDVVCVRLSAQIPALHARREATRLTFTPDTWAAVRAALELRDADEAILGWWHSHPNWCRNCATDRKKVCPLNRVFFSKDDCDLHRTVFARAYQLGLLLSVRDDGIIPALFGWRRGIITARSFHLLDSPAPDETPAPAVTATIGGSERAIRS